MSIRVMSVELISAGLAFAMCQVESHTVPFWKVTLMMVAREYTLEFIEFIEFGPSANAIDLAW